MEKKPLVSIIINNYNYGHFLRDAIDSALKQTYPYKEVIVVDDGSIDQSREIIISYEDKIVPILKDNGGQASAFNAGFAASNGDIICFLDADDTFVPEKLVEVMDIFKSYQDIGWCFHYLSWLDNNTRKFIKNGHRRLVGECDFRAQIVRNRVPPILTATSGLCFTRPLLQQILPMPEDIRITSDEYLKSTAVALNKGFFLTKELAIQKIHGDNAYTLRNDRQQLQAKIAILTAYWLQIKFPSLTMFTKSVLIKGIVIFWRNGGIEPESKRLITSYLSTVSQIEKLKIYSRAIYRYLRPTEP